MAKVDTEVLFNKLKAYIKTSIGSKVAEINAEKGGTNLLIAPNEKAYIDLSLDDAVINFDPFVFIFLDSVTSLVQGPVVNKTIRFEVCLFKSRAGKPDEHILGLRYLRLMEELGAGAWDKAFNGYRYDIETLTPIDVKLANSTKWHRVYGIALTVSLS